MANVNPITGQKVGEGGTVQPKVTGTETKVTPYTSQAEQKKKDDKAKREAKKADKAPLSAKQAGKVAPKAAKARPAATA